MQIDVHVPPIVSVMIIFEANDCVRKMVVVGVSVSWFRMWLMRIRTEGILVYD